MAETRLLDDILASFDVTLTQHERLLTLRLGGTDFVPHRLVGEERLSRPFTYTLDCVSQRGDLELKTLIAQ
ncbi:hypothetical protein QC820_12350, partial [Halomonas mongoliensis]